MARTQFFSYLFYFFIYMLDRADCCNRGPSAALDGEKMVQKTDIPIGQAWMLSLSLHVSQGGGQACAAEGPS